MRARPSATTDAFTNHTRYAGTSDTQALGGAPMTVFQSPSHAKTYPAEALIATGAFRSPASTIASGTDAAANTATTVSQGDWVGSQAH